MPEDIEITKENVFEVDIEKLALDDRFGDLKFTDTSSQLLQIQEWLKEAHDFNYQELLISDDIGKINELTKALVALLKRLKRFDITEEDSLYERDEINEHVEEFYQNVYTEVAMRILLFLREKRRKENPEQQRLDAEIARVSEIKAELEKEVKKLEKQQEELKAKQQEAEEVYAGLREERKGMVQVILVIILCDKRIYTKEIRGDILMLLRLLY